jgi:hypothetical protein
MAIQNVGTAADRVYVRPHLNPLPQERKKLLRARLKIFSSHFAITDCRTSFPKRGRFYHAMDDDSPSPGGEGWGEGVRHLLKFSYAKLADFTLCHKRGHETGTSALARAGAVTWQYQKPARRQTKCTSVLTLILSPREREKLLFGYLISPTSVSCWPAAGLRFQITVNQPRDGQ